jgi:hypothetical protein
MSPASNTQHASLPSRGDTQSWFLDLDHCEAHPCRFRLRLRAFLCAQQVFPGENYVQGIRSSCQENA